VGVAVPDRDNGVAAIQVQVAPALLIPKVGSLSLDRGDIEKRINVEEIHVAEVRGKRLDNKGNT
jgi:hypothetical protein